MSLLNGIGSGFPELSPSTQNSNHACRGGFPWPGSSSIRSPPVPVEFYSQKGFAVVILSPHRGQWYRGQWTEIELGNPRLSGSPVRTARTFLVWVSMNAM